MLKFGISVCKLILSFEKIKKRKKAELVSHNSLIPGAAGIFAYYCKFDIVVEYLLPSTMHAFDE